MKSYFKFLSRNKAYTFINIAGLVTSLMFIILMGDYTWRQYSIDSWHKNAEVQKQLSFFQNKEKLRVLEKTQHSKQKQIVHCECCYKGG